MWTCRCRQSIYFNSMESLAALLEIRKGQKTWKSITGNNLSSPGSGYYTYKNKYNSIYKQQQEKKLTRIVPLIKTSIYQPPAECLRDTANLTLPSSVTRCWINDIKELNSKHGVAVFQAHLEARDKAHNTPFTAGHTTALLLPSVTAPLLNLISSN